MELYLHPPGGGIPLLSRELSKRLISTTRSLLCILLVIIIVALPLGCSQSKYSAFSSRKAHRLPDRRGAFGVLLNHDGVANHPDGTQTAAMTIRGISANSTLLGSPVAVGDQIFSVNGLFFSRFDDMRYYIRSLTPGSLTTLQYFDASQRMFSYTATVRVGDVTQMAKPEDTLAIAYNSAIAQRLPDRRGAFGVLLSPTGVANHPNGTQTVAATIRGIGANSTLLGSPVAVGDQLFSVNGRFFSSLDAMVRYISSLKPHSLATIQYFDASQRMLAYATSVYVGDRTQLVKPEDTLAVASRPPRNPAQPAYTPSVRSRTRQPSFPWKRDNDTSDNSAVWAGIGAAVLLGGVLWCAFGGCGGSDSGTEEGNTTGSDTEGSDSAYEAWRQRQEEEEPTQEAPAPPDTSIGCPWGDRKFGTCPQ